MRWCVVVVLWAVSVVAVWAQDVQPKLEVTFEENETVPGQPLTLPAGKVAFGGVTEKL